MVDVSQSASPLIFPKEADITSDVNNYPQIIKLFKTPASDQARYVFSPLVKRRFDGYILKKEVVITRFNPQKEVVKFEVEYGMDEMILLSSLARETGLWPLNDYTFKVPIPALTGGEKVTLKAISTTLIGVLTIYYRLSPAGTGFMELTDLSNEAIEKLQELIRRDDVYQGWEV